MRLRPYTDLLARCGGGLSLAEAATALDVSCQAMHEQIHAGQVLSVMLGDQMVVPKLQIHARQGGRNEILPGINRIVRLFRDSQAGPWAALPFLIEPDPNLSTTPIAALRDGKVDAVAHAVSAYLRTDEE